MKLTMLGTGNALVTECYNTCFSLQDGSDCFLIDGGGGNGILHQLKYAGIALESIRDIFVTHKHYDHITGVLWLVRVISQYMSFGKYNGEVNIYSHSEVISLIREISKRILSSDEASFLDSKIHLLEVQDGEIKYILNRPVSFFDIHSEKAKQFGFSISFDNNEFLTCCGDEPVEASAYRYVDGCTWLMHEAFCLDSEAGVYRPYERHHSTVKDVCELAERMRVKNLILYHTEDHNLKQRQKTYLEEGHRFYRGNLYVPYDFDSFIL